MKKTIAILLVAVLAAGSLFAGLSGEASVKAGVDLDKKEWGFLENGTNVKFDLSLGKEDVENVAEGEVYASIKASFEAKIANDPYRGSSSIDVIDSNGNYLPFYSHNKDLSVKTYNTANGFMYPVRVRASVSEAKVFGSNWYVSILGVPNAPDFAKSAIDTEEDKAAGSLDDWGFGIKDATSKAVSYKVAYDKAPGVEAGYADYVVGVGLKASNAGKAYTAFAQTPEYEFDAVKAQFAAVASKAAATGVNNIGASAKASYATDVLSTSVAADLGVAAAKETKIAMDLAANVKYDFVTVDAYLNTAKAAKEEKGKAEALPVLLSAKVATDLNAFDVPVKVELTGKDLLATTDLSVKATVTAIENLELTVSGGYVLNTIGRDAELMFVNNNHKNYYLPEKLFAGQWSAKVGAKYTASFATISGEVSLKNWGLADAYKNVFKAQKPGATPTEAEKVLSDAYLDAYKDDIMNAKSLDVFAKRLVLGAKVSVENETLIPGATLKLAWEGKDLANKCAKGVTKGTVAATCTIKF